MVHLIFCRCLEGGTLYADIDAVLHLDVFLLGNLVGQRHQRQIVGLVHIREARTCREVLSTKRMLREEVDVVGDNHQVADFEFWVHATGCVGNEEGLDAQLVHHAHREGHLLHRVTLVEVESSLHGHDVLASQFTEDQFA